MISTFVFLKLSFLGNIKQKVQDLFKSKQESKVKLQLDETIDKKNSSNYPSKR